MWIGLGLLVVPGVVLNAAVVSVTAHLVFDLDWTAALLMGAVLAPTDPAILIPLFVRSRLRPKVAQTVVVGLYPSWSISEESVAAADEFLAGDHPPALRRLVVEGGAGIVRSLAAWLFDAS